MLLHKGTITIETERLILRRFVIDDAEAMYNNWATDTEVTKFITWGPHPNVEFTRNLMKDWVDAYINDNVYNWVIEIKDEKR